MARVSAPLDTAAPFPQLELDLTDDERLYVPGDFLGRYALMLIYRGKW